MTTVYGNQIEPGGMKLEDNSFKTECPECGSKEATEHHWEAAEGGSINTYYSIDCDCGFFETNGDIEE